MTDKQKRPPGRPRLPPGDAKTARVEWRTTTEIKQRAQAAADASGLSLGAWLDELVSSASTNKPA